MIAKSDFHLSSGSDFHEKPIEATSTSAFIRQLGRATVNRKCRIAASYLTGSPSDFQTF